MYSILIMHSKLHKFRTLLHFFTSDQYFIHTFTPGQKKTIYWQKQGENSGDVGSCCFNKPNYENHSKYVTFHIVYFKSSLLTAKMNAPVIIRTYCTQNVQIYKSNKKKRSNFKVHKKRSFVHCNCSTH